MDKIIDPIKSILKISIDDLKSRQIFRFEEKTLFEIS